jgi:ppGpp synthetase/RelA/SpoT-type nucleotidyltranferase
MLPYKVTYGFNANISENLANKVLKKEILSVTQRVKELEKLYEKLK